MLFRSIRYLGAALVGTGLGLSVVGAVKATIENNKKLAVFDALLFVGGSIVALQSGQSSVSRLIAAADDALARNGAGKGAAYGTRVHTTFARIIKSWGDSDFFTEQSYLNGKHVDYGTPGSIRVDVGEGPVDDPSVVYDLKTGSAELTLQRVQQIQSHLPGGSSVPVIEIRGSGQQ